MSITSIEPQAQNFGAQPKRLSELTSEESNHLARASPQTVSATTSLERPQPTTPTGTVMNNPLIPRNIKGLQDLLFDQIDETLTRPGLDFGARQRSILATTAMLLKSAQIDLSHKRLTRHAPDIAARQEPTLQLGSQIDPPDRAA